MDYYKKYLDQKIIKGKNDEYMIKSLVMMTGGVLQMKGEGQINNKIVLIQHQNIVIPQTYYKFMLNIDRLSHVILIYDIIIDNNHDGIFIIMEDYNFNQLLTNYLKQKQQYSNYESEEFQNLIFQICLGLQELHQLNIIHKSISSDNIVVQTIDDKQIKFLLTNVNLSQYDKNDRVLDAPLTFQIIPPELAKRMPFDYKVDIWSFGCLIYKLITKKDLFKEPTQNQTLEQIKNCDQSYIDRRINLLEIDEKFKNILKSMICIDINARLDIIQIYQLFNSYYNNQGQIPIIKPLTKFEDINQQQEILQLQYSIEEDAILNKIQKIVLEQNVPEEIQKNIINKLDSELINFFYNKTQMDIQKIKSELQ